MKRILILASIFVLACGSIVYSQKYIRHGNTFEQVSKTKNTTEATETGFFWKSSDGKRYPIYLSSKGTPYILKTSKKTGKEYKQYLPKDIKYEMDKDR